MKERIVSVTDGLTANGVAVKIEGDDFIGHRSGIGCGGGRVEVRHDHRTAMSFLVMGVATDAPVAVDDAALADSTQSFPALLS